MWYPGKLADVDLVASGFAERESGGDCTACCFSGGVDSFYSLLRHLPDAEPDPAYRVGQALFVHGFDIPLAEKGFYDRLADRYEAALAPLGVELIRCRTNLREMLDPHLSWMTAHGAALQSVAHFLAAGLRRLVIPSTNRFSLFNPPIGSNPITDPQLSSERLELLHDGCDASRIEKIVAIADDPVAQRHLRVCFQPPGATENCGRCVKCQKTMLPLWAIGRLDRFG